MTKQVIKQAIELAGSMLSLVVLAVLATPVQGEDDFPLVGTYTENQACKADGSDPGVSRVKITPREDKTIDFSDQDQTYKAVLHRCPD